MQKGLVDPGGRPHGKLLGDCRDERSPSVGGERDYRSAAVSGIADQHGAGRSDLYAGAAVVPGVAALAPVACHCAPTRSISTRDSDALSASLLSVSKRISRLAMISASSKTCPATAVSA